MVLIYYAFHGNQNMMQAINYINRTIFVIDTIYNISMASYLFYKERNQSEDNNLMFSLIIEFLILFLLIFRIFGIQEYNNILDKFRWSIIFVGLMKMTYFYYLIYQIISQLSIESQTSSQIISYIFSMFQLRIIIFLIYVQKLDTNTEPIKLQKIKKVYHIVNFHAMYLEDSEIRESLFLRNFVKINYNQKYQIISYAINNLFCTCIYIFIFYKISFNVENFSENFFIILLYRCNGVNFQV